MLGEFDSRKDSQSTKSEQRPQIFMKLSFKELFKLLKSSKVGCEFMRHQSLILVTLTEDPSVVKNDTHRLQKYPHLQR